jgi:N-acetylmuramic acid 6-phosphate etherase
VEDNKMVNMQLSNQKLIDRGVRMMMEARPQLEYEEAKKLLLQSGSVIEALKKIAAK